MSSCKWDYMDTLPYNHDVVDILVKSEDSAGILVEDVIFSMDNCTFISENKIYKFQEIQAWRKAIIN